MIDLSATAVKISNARKEKGFTQDELAVRLGVSTQAVSKWERALSLPDIDLLLDVSKILDIPINCLLDKDAREANGTKAIYDLSRINLFDDKSVRIDPLLVRFGLDFVPLFTHENNILERVVQIRRDTLRAWGVLLPPIRLMDDSALNAGQYTIEVFGKLRYDSVLETVTEAAKDELITSLQSVINECLPQFVNRHMVKLLVDNLKSLFPFCVEGVIPERITLSKLKSILKKLVAERCSIRDLYTIIETIDDHIDGHPDIDALVRILQEALV